MAKRLKVLQLQPKYYIRENDLHEEIIRGLPRDEFEVTSAYMRERQQPGGLTSLGEHTKYFDFKKSEMKGLRLRGMHALYKYCKEEKFDTVITHRFKPCDMMMTLNKSLKIPRCISVMHGYGDYDRFYRRLMNHIRIDDHWKFVTVSDPIKQYLLDQKCGFNEGNVVTINNAINIDQITSGFENPAKIRKKFSLTDDQFIIGTIGRMVDIKGHIFLLKAFHKLLQNNSNIHLVIFGDGESRPEIEHYIQSNSISDYVTLAGHVESAYKYTPLFDVFTLPSLSEGLPLSLLEAMAAKIPIIATDVGGVAGVLNGIGTVIPPSDTGCLYAALSEMMKCKQRKQIGITLRNHLEKEYSIETYRDRYRKLITGESW